MRKALPLTYLFLALVLMALLHLGLPVYRYWSVPIGLLGIVPLVLGIVLNMTSDRAFKKHRTTVKPFEESSALITDFPFSVSRNPMYVGMTLMLLGIALLLGTVSTLVPVLVFPFLMNRLFIREEERMLAATFCGEWEQYRSAVRRWL